MKARVYLTGKGTEEDPIRPKLSNPVTWGIVKIEDNTAIIWIKDEDYEKIKDDVIEVFPDVP